MVCDTFTLCRIIYTRTGCNFKGLISWDSLRLNCTLSGKISKEWVHLFMKCVAFFVTVSFNTKVHCKRERDLIFPYTSSRMTVGETEGQNQIIFPNFYQSIKNLFSTCWLIREIVQSVLITFSKSCTFLFGKKLRRSRVRGTGIR